MARRIHTAHKHFSDRLTASLIAVAAAVVLARVAPDERAAVAARLQDLLQELIVVDPPPARPAWTH